ncbi:arylesterase [Marinobacter sp.]|uniref:arylesterase n=1 Tax=Marinobacter sp. TaxID=50741 RepID=UPI00384CEBBB
MTMNTVFSSLRSILFLSLVLLSAPTFGSSPTILIMGDSLSAAYGVETERAWVPLLKDRLEKTSHDDWAVINASISGETTDGGLRRLPDLLSRHSPEIVIIELGGNDGLRGFPPGVIEDNLSAMIEKSQQSGARTLLVGMQLPPNYGQRYTQAFAAIYPELAEQHSVALVPFFLEGIYNQEKMMQSDGIHPTAEAQSKLLENVWPELETLLEKEKASN